MSTVDLHSFLDTCFTAQNNATALWHELGFDDVDPDAASKDAEYPGSIPDPASDIPASSEALRAFVLAQHMRNFLLWHIEDIARRRDVTPERIAECKYRIDRLNQERNDRIERVDACLVHLVYPLLPAQSASAINTESLGMAIDRLSILSLKVWHMREQTERTDVAAEHIASCVQKLEVLKQQRIDLAGAVHTLLDEYINGTKQPKLYFQFKMYNDPALNPQLYGK